MNLADAASIHWKSKFIDGFPNLFAEKVRNRLREINGGSIHYYTYTYGTLINACIHEGLAIYNDMKLRNQLRF